MKYVSGDLLNATEKYIAQGCNCQGIMGAGVALALKNKYPSVYISYIRHLKAYKNLYAGEPLGSACFAAQEDGKVIINLFTQRFYGRSGVHATTKAIKSAINTALDVIEVEDMPISIAIPKIGAGYGGLPWKEVEEVLLDLEKERYVKFVVYSLDKGS